MTVTVPGSRGVPCLWRSSSTRRHPRCPLPCRCALRSPRTLRPPRDLQHRPGQPVYQPGVHRRAARTHVPPSPWPARTATCTNLFIERLSRSLKYEALYLHELSAGFQPQRLISSCFAFNDHGTPHSVLGDATPAQAYADEMLLQRPAQRRNSPASLPAPPERQGVLYRTLAA